jgi:hypothetical protein
LSLSSELSVSSEKFPGLSLWRLAAPGDASI